MDLFDCLFLNIMLILFPLLIYIIYLCYNKNLNDKMKNSLLNLAAISSFFLLYKYSNYEYFMINYLITSIIVLILFIYNHYICANILTLFIIIIYYNYFSFLCFFPYLLLNILYIFKNIRKISDLVFIDLFILIQCIFFIISNHFNLNNILVLLCSNLVIYIIYFLFQSGENIIKHHMEFKKLQQEKQIRLSLFKITHEIKNPIAVCKGYLDMLNINNEEQVRKYIPIIKSEIERLLTLLQDFLLVNRENIEFDIMDINLLLEDVINKLKPMLDDRKIKLECNLIDDDIYINGDYKRLSQVLINLLKNSIEAIPERRDGIIKINNKIKNNQIDISIIDNGVGISEKTMKRMKEPFYTTKVRGTGLGVSLSDEILKAHNGYLKYESEEGIKTKTIIKLPLYKEAK